MQSQHKHIRHGMGSVRPYLYGRRDSLDLIVRAFGGEVLENLPVGSAGFHVEARIGDSMLVLEQGETLPPGATRASVYVYVEDVDSAFRAALEAGATSIAEPADKPYQERGAGVRDVFGNIWWIATYTGA
ncbi:MAG TPA: VOC family protein [Candidatus Binataceae bacterium]|nr:VOC family protein [Candidatus Binataceae bacterium]